METPVPFTDGVETITLVCKKCDYFTTNVCKVGED